MKIYVAQLQYLMKGSHLCEDNTHIRTWCSDYIDYKIEHVMHKCLDLYPQFCNLILVVGFNFGANLTIRSSLNRWDQFITIGSS